MSDFVVGKAESQKMLMDMNISNIFSKKEVAKTIKERRKSMTVADLKAMLKNMPDDAEVTADENAIEKVTADIDLNGNIERVDLVLK